MQKYDVKFTISDLTAGETPKVILVAPRRPTY